MRSRHEKIGVPFTGVLLAAVIAISCHAQKGHALRLLDEQASTTTTTAAAAAEAGSEQTQQGKSPVETKNASEVSVSSSSTTTTTQTTLRNFAENAYNIPPPPKEANVDSAERQYIAAPLASALGGNTSAFEGDNVVKATKEREPSYLQSSIGLVLVLIPIAVMIILCIFIPFIWHVQEGRRRQLERHAFILRALWEVLWLQREERVASSTEFSTRLRSLRELSTDDDDDSPPSSASAIQSVRIGVGPPVLRTMNLGTSRMVIL